MTQLNTKMEIELQTSLTPTRVRNLVWQKFLWAKQLLLLKKVSGNVLSIKIFWSLAAETKASAGQSENTVSHQTNSGGCILAESI